MYLQEKEVITMVSETTCKAEFRKAIDTYKADKFEYVHNRGGYVNKIQMYDICESDLPEIQKNLKYGKVQIEGDFTNKRIWYINEADRCYFSYGLIFHPCDPCEITQVDEHHTYGTTMTVDGYPIDAEIEKILKQSEKAIYVRMVKASGFRYERWLPKSTIYRIDREITFDGVISKYTQLCESWQVIVLGCPQRTRTYGDIEHYNARIQNLKDDGCEVVEEQDVDGVHTAYIFDKKEIRAIKGLAIYWGEEYVENSAKDKVTCTVYRQKQEELEMCYHVLSEKGLWDKEGVM